MLEVLTVSKDEVTVGLVQLKNGGETFCLYKASCKDSSPFEHISSFFFCTLTGSSLASILFGWDAGWWGLSAFLMLATLRTTFLLSLGWPKLQGGWISRACGAFLATPFVFVVAGLTGMMDSASTLLSGKSLRVTQKVIG